MPETPDTPDATSAPTPSPAPGAAPSPNEPPVLTAGLLARATAGGALMGLANLVPGISGGTMLLATGIYTRFVTAIAELSTLRLSRHAIFVMVSVIAAAGLAILLLAGPIKTLVVEHRWVMYSLFIGLTLGGVPIVWRLVGGMTRGAWVGAAMGLVAMAALAMVQAAGADDAIEREGFIFMVLAGIAGAGAMILPGLSGGYLLLLLGVYVPILAAVDALRQAATAGDTAAMLSPATTVLLPVGIGIVLGVVVVSNALRWLLRRFAKPTLGVLLGLLLGAVAGLWPFQAGIEPQPGDTLRGQTVRFEDGVPHLHPSGRELRPDQYPTRFFTPAPGQVAGAVGLILLGCATTTLIGRLGRNRASR